MIRWMSIRWRPATLMITASVFWAFVIQSVAEMTPTIAASITPTKQVSRTFSDSPFLISVVFPRGSVPPVPSRCRVPAEEEHRHLYLSFSLVHQGCSGADDRHGRYFDSKAKNASRPIGFTM